MDTNKEQCREQLIAKEVFFEAIPTLLFTNPSSTMWYFDATHYLEEQDDKKEVTVFFQKLKPIVQQICEAYKIDNADLAFQNNQGHILIRGELKYLFLMWFNKEFLLYAMYVLEELFTTGYVLSDETIIRIIKEKIPKSVLEQLLKDTENATNQTGETGPTV